MSWVRISQRGIGLPFFVVAVAMAIGLGYQVALRRDLQPASRAASLSAASLTSTASLRLMSTFEPAFAGEMLAERAGLFQREGVEIVLREGGDADDPIASVVGGSDVFGVTRADSFLMARAKGAPIVAFAASYIESPAVFYVLKKSGLRVASDLVGHRVGRRSGDDTSVAYDALVARLGLPRSRISEVPVAGDLSMLVRGDVDAWPGHVGAEDYALDQRGVDYVLLNPASYGVHLPGTVYFAAEQTIAERPQLVQRFLNGVIAGWELTYADYLRGVPMIAAFDEQRLTPDYIRRTLDRQREYRRPIAVRFGEFNDAQWRTLQETLLAQRLLEGPADLARAVNYDFLREAYRKPLAFGRSSDLK